MTGKPAIFFDRDGTLIVETGYLHEPDKVELMPGAGEAVSRLAKDGFELFIVTNQAGIGRGYFTEEQMHATNTSVCKKFSRAVIPMPRCLALMMPAVTVLSKPKG